MRLLDELVAYVQRNEVESWREHAAMATQLAGLLREKAGLVSAYAALQMRQDGGDKAAAAAASEADAPVG